MKIIHLELKELNHLVEKFHRHHKPVQGHRFSLGLEDKGAIIGGCSVGRPVSREINYRQVLEVTRLVTMGNKNACSMLYSAAARAGRELGYLKIQTYILESESGISLRASGWICEGNTIGKQWTPRNGVARRTDQPNCNKQRWIKILNIA